MGLEKVTSGSRDGNADPHSREVIDTSSDTVGGADDPANLDVTALITSITSGEPDCTTGEIGEHVGQREGSPGRGPTSQFEISSMTKAIHMSRRMFADECPRLPICFTL